MPFYFLRNKNSFWEIETTVTIPVAEYNQLKQDNLLLHRHASELNSRWSELMKIIEALQQQQRLLRNGKNSGSERAVRNIKVKVSGQFRSEREATRFAIRRSVTNITIKNAQNIFEALTHLFNSQT